MDFRSLSRSSSLNVGNRISQEPASALDIKNMTPLPQVNNNGTSHHSDSIMVNERDGYPENSHESNAKPTLRSLSLLPSDTHSRNHNNSSSSYNQYYSNKPRVPSTSTSATSSPPTSYRAGLLSHSTYSSHPSNSVIGQQANLPALSTSPISPISVDSTNMPYQQKETSASSYVHRLKFTSPRGGDRPYPDIRSPEIRDHTLLNRNRQQLQQAQYHHEKNHTRTTDNGTPSLYSADTTQLTTSSTLSITPAFVNSSGPNYASANMNSSSEQNTPTGKKPKSRNFHCMAPGCGKSFTCSGHLVRHERMHSGEKPFACHFPRCNSKFSRHDNMMQHYKNHFKKMNFKDKSLDSTTLDANYKGKDATAFPSSNSNPKLSSERSSNSFSSNDMSGNDTGSGTPNLDKSMSRIPSFSKLVDSLNNSRNTSQEFTMGMHRHSSAEFFGTRFDPLEYTSRHALPVYRGGQDSVPFSDPGIPTTQKPPTQPGSFDNSEPYIHNRNSYQYGRERAHTTGRFPEPPFTLK